MYTEEIQRSCTERYVIINTAYTLFIPSCILGTCRIRRTQREWARSIVSIIRIYFGYYGHSNIFSGIQSPCIAALKHNDRNTPTITLNPTHQMLICRMPFLFTLFLGEAKGIQWSKLNMQLLTSPRSKKCPQHDHYIKQRT